MRESAFGLFSDPQSINPAAAGFVFVFPVLILIWSLICFLLSSCSFSAFARTKQNPRLIRERGFLMGSLTMTYFHTGCSTIIGAKSFHGPVRDGKGWYQLAMVIRLKLSAQRSAAPNSEDFSF